MATKRTDAFDVFTSDKDRRDADIKALKAMSPHSTLKGMGRPVAPLLGAAQGTVPPPVSIQDAEAILLAAETQITHNPLHAQDPYVEELVNADDLIELIDESGLLVLDADQGPDDAIEVSSSFLMEDLDGFPAGLQTAAVPDFSDSSEEIEEITSNHLAYVETRGEIVEVIRPRLPTVEEVPLLNRHNLYNDSAEYSDGIPRLSTQPRGLSSKTLRVPAPRAEGQARGWLWNAAVGLVFMAGIGAGVAFAMHSSAKTTPAASPAAVDVAALAAPVATAPEAEEVAEPVVAPLGDTKSELADLEVVEPTVVPLDVDSLDLEAAVSDLEADEAAADVGAEEATEASAAAEAGPVVTALPMEPTSEEVAEPAPTKRSARSAAKSSAKSESRPRPSAKAAESAEPAKREAKSETRSAIISAGSTLPSADPGVLMLAAKPPCEIRIDGKTTGLTTPQRVLKLAPGNHRVTLTNQEHQIKDSFKVSIVSGKKTRIVRDNTSKIK